MEVTIEKYSDFTLDLLFHFNIEKAKFVLNGVVINEMLVNDLNFKYVLNPSFLNEGVNNLIIITTDSELIESEKKLQIDKSLILNTLSVGDALNIKGVPYIVNAVVGDSVTLNQPLLADVPLHTFAESPTYTIDPYADLTFYNDIPTLKPMQFVKSIYLDGLIEDVYEISGVLGDVLHTKIELFRDDVTHDVHISNIERILMPDEVQK